MPSPAKPAASLPPARGDICVFGDSHIGSVKLALDAGLIETGGREISFWGADGPSFRGLRWKDGRIVPDEAARDMVAQVSGGARKTLGPDDFDLFIFYGARLRTRTFFWAMLEHMHRPEGQLSEAALHTTARRWSQKTRAWRFAGAFAAAGAKVIFVPTSFPSTGVLEAGLEKQRLRIKSTMAERARLWQALHHAASAQGFGLMPQPDNSVTEHTLTAAKYAVPGAAASKDAVHKTPEFAAMMMAGALILADQGRAKCLT